MPGFAIRVIQACVFSTVLFSVICDAQMVARPEERDGGLMSIGGLISLGVIVLALLVVVVIYYIDNSQSRQGVDSFQQRVAAWAKACFGRELAQDKRNRCHRFLEEALELAQSMGCTEDEAKQLVDYVFARPIGEAQQEVGGTKLTLAALCNAADIDLDGAGEKELARVWQKIHTIRDKSNNRPANSALPQ